MRQMKELNGIPNMRKEPRRTYVNWNTPVLFAAGASFRKKDITMGKTDFVQIDANRHTEEKRGKTMSSRFVKFAAENTQPINIKKQNGARTVKIESIELDGFAPVYNMEVVDNHDFSIFGGLIVHNCMDDVRYFVRAAFAPSRFSF